jgi:predicted MFS family arabinose efflux permease
VVELLAVEQELADDAQPQRVAFYIVGLLGSLLVSGVLSDRVGRRPVLLPALALAMAACLIFATASTVAALVVARLSPASRSARSSPPEWPR